MAKKLIVKNILFLKTLRNNGKSTKVVVLMGSIVCNFSIVVVTKNCFLLNFVVK